MICYKRLSCFLLAIVCCCYHGNVFAQQSDWLKGWWMYYHIKPAVIKGKVVESELNIISVTDNDYTGIQKIYVSGDTSAFVKRECSGSFSNDKILFIPGKEIDRKEPNEVYIWDAYTKYAVEKTYFSISQHKLVLHIVAKSEQDDFVKEFAYYRDLLPLPFLLRTQLEKRYGSPQLLDNADTVIVVKPLEPDMDDTTSYVNTLPGSDTLPQDIITRKNTLVKTLEVSSPDIQVILLDDAEIDGDIVSLYHNNELVLNHKTIGKEMVKYAVKADAAHTHHEFTLVAENLGSIPPNTALVRIRAGEIKYEFVVHSDMHENVKFVIDYVGDKKIDITAPH